MLWSHVPRAVVCSLWCTSSGRGHHVRLPNHAPTVERWQNLNDRRDTGDTFGWARVLRCPKGRTGDLSEGQEEEDPKEGEAGIRKIKADTVRRSPRGTRGWAGYTDDLR